MLSPWPPPPDGVGYHSVALANSWRSAGHDTLVVTSKSKESREFRPLESDEYDIHVARILGLVPRKATTRLVGSYEPDVAIVQFTIASQNTSLFSTLKLMHFMRRLGIPVVVAYHESAREIDRLGAISRWIYRAASKGTTVPVAYSQAASSALRAGGIFDEVVEVAHGCKAIVDASPEDLTRVRDRYDITSPLVLSLGFSHPDKGTELLANSVTAINQQLEGNVQFLFAGSPRKRRGIFRLMGRIDQRFHDLTVAKLALLKDVSVDFRGFVPEEDIMPLLFLSSAVVLPYRSATQSGIANLALSARAVIVASDIPELRDDLGPAAHYFRSGDSADLTTTIVSVINTDQVKIRRAAAARAKDRSYDATAATLLGIRFQGTDQSE